MTEQPKVSPDGNYWWDGTAWQLFQRPPPVAQTAKVGHGLRNFLIGCAAACLLVGSLLYLSIPSRGTVASKALLDAGAVCGATAEINMAPSQGCIDALHSASIKLAQLSGCDSADRIARHVAEAESAGDGRTTLDALTAAENLAADDPGLRTCGR